MLSTRDKEWRVKVQRLLLEDDVRSILDYVAIHMILYSFLFYVGKFLFDQIVRMIP